MSYMRDFALTSVKSLTLRGTFAQDRKSSSVGKDTLISSKALTCCDSQLVFGPQLSILDRTGNRNPQLHAGPRQGLEKYVLNQRATLRATKLTDWRAP